MNFKKIIIYKFDFLFNILDEIKENLNFELIEGNSKNIDQEIKLLGADYLVLSKSKRKTFNNQIFLNEFPIKIDKLLETINLNFLKKRFNLQSDISIGDYKLNLNSRKINKEGITIDLTEREINLIFFLKDSKTSVKVEQLQKKVWDYGVDLDTHTVETHIYRLRKKIKEKFNDSNFIISSKSGYSLDEKKK